MSWRNCWGGGHSGGSSPGVGKGKGGGREQQRAHGQGPGGWNRQPGDWKMLKNHRRMLVHMMDVAPAELQKAESACADAEQDFCKEKTRKNLDALQDAKDWVKTGS